MLIKTLLTLLLATASLSARADYEPTLLTELVGKASLIIEARIIVIGRSTFTIQPTRVFKGMVLTSIVVDKFKNWTCASRFAPYAVGQQAVYFLSQNKSGHYYTLGAANEGEVPLFKESIYYQTAHLRLDKNPKLFHIYTGGVWGYQYKHSDFAAAIKLLINQSSLASYLKGNAQAIADTTNNPVIHRFADEYVETHSRLF